MEFVMKENEDETNFRCRHRWDLWCWWYCWCQQWQHDHLQRLAGGVHVDSSEVLGQGEVAELTLDVIVRLHSWSLSSWCWWMWSKPVRRPSYQRSVLLQGQGWAWAENELNLEFIIGWERCFLRPNKSSPWGTPASPWSYQDLQTPLSNQSGPGGNKAGQTWRERWFLPQLFNFQTREGKSQSLVRVQAVPLHSATGSKRIVRIVWGRSHITSAAGGGRGVQAKSWPLLTRGVKNFQQRDFMWTKMLIHLILADVICEQPPSESVAHKVRVTIHEQFWPGWRRQWWPRCRAGWKSE